MATKIEPEYLGRGLFQPAVKLADYLWEFINENPLITRDEIERATGVPRTTIYDTIVKLMLDGRMKRELIPSKTRGRPRVGYLALKVEN